MNEYIIVNKTAVESRIAELEEIFAYQAKHGHGKLCHETNLQLTELKHILSQSTSLIPELQKTWNAAYIDALSIDEETYKPLFFKDYISNLKLDI